MRAPGRTTGTSSRLLYDALGSVFDQLGFGVVDDPVFRDLVIARIVEPTSITDAARVLTELGAPSKSPVSKAPEPRRRSCRLSTRSAPATASPRCRW